MGGGLTGPRPKRIEASKGNRQADADKHLDLIRAISRRLFQEALGAIDQRERRLYRWLRRLSARLPHSCSFSWTR